MAAAAAAAAVAAAAATGAGAAAGEILGAAAAGRRGGSAGPAPDEDEAAARREGLIGVLVVDDVGLHWCEYECVIRDKESGVGFIIGMRGLVVDKAHHQKSHVAHLCCRELDSEATLRGRRGGTLRRPA